jgi:uncharacterized protein
MHWLRKKRWSPYVVGALIGVLSWFKFWTVDRPIGVSTAVARTAGMLERVVAPGHVASNAYFSKFRPAVDWEWMLVRVAGMLCGAGLFAEMYGVLSKSVCPGSIWARRRCRS